MYLGVCSSKKEIFRVWSFSEKFAAKGNSLEAIDKYSHVFICNHLNKHLSSEQKPIYNVKILISEQIGFAAVLYFGQKKLYFLFSAG